MQTVRPVNHRSASRLHVVFHSVPEIVKMIINSKTCAGAIVSQAKNQPTGIGRRRTCRGMTRYSGYTRVLIIVLYKAGEAMFVWVCNLQYVLALVSTHFYNCYSQLSMSKCEINCRQFSSTSMCRRRTEDQKRFGNAYKWLIS